MPLTALVLGLVVAAMPTTNTAEAAIACRGGFQRVQGNDISTPYCQDEYLAQVAQQYGVRTSGSRIRGNPNHKREVCRLVGRDIRVQQTCVDELPTGRGGRF
jgi:hypothetical protein